MIFMCTLPNNLLYSVLDDCIYQECIQAMESHLEKEAAKRALEKLYTERAGNEKRKFLNCIVCTELESL